MRVESMLESTPNDQEVNELLRNIEAQRTMTIFEFASKHRLRIKRDECGEQTVLGKRGIISEFDTSKGLLAATILGAPSAQHWNTHSRAMRAAGCTIAQNGDAEGTVVFDPADTNQTDAALRAIQARRKRTVHADRAENFKGRKPPNQTPSFLLQTTIEYRAG